MDTMERLKGYPKKLHIMFNGLEDDRDTLEEIEEALKEAGVEYRLFMDPSDLLKNIDENVHICALDYYMGGTNGVEVLKKIREKNPWAYVIGMSGQGNPDVIIQFLNAGANKYIDKRKGNYLKTLVEYIRDAIEIVKKDFEFYQFLLTEKAKHESRAIEKPAGPNQ